MPPSFARSTALTPEAPPPAQRVLSVDVLRGLTMLTMVFVNDVAVAKDLPRWLGHYPAGGNGMTFVDVVFPAFLFIVGMSIPLAIESRRARGDGWLRIYGHVVFRTLALLVIGVLMVDSPDAAVMGWPPGLWKSLMYAGVIGAFHAVRTERPAARFASTAVRVVSSLLLLYLAVSFRSATGGYLHPKWWGILGLIGWAYFWSATAYVLFRRAGHAALAAAAAVMMGVYFGDRAGAFAFADAWRWDVFGRVTLAPAKWVDVATQWGSQPAVTMFGVVVGWTLSPGVGGWGHAARVGFAVAFAALLGMAGLLLYPTFGIDKNAATPTWCLWSAAITAVVWVAFYGVIDVAGWRRWATPLAWAGAAALLIYILAGLWYATTSLFGWQWWQHLGARYPEAVLRASVAAVLLTLVGGILGRLGFRLRV
jgi:predicted acyltransferase